MSNVVSIIPVGNLIKTRNDKSKKLQSTEYLKNGILPIVDQSSKLICGYTNDQTKSYDAGLPVVVFGDHTLHTKYIDFNFAVGADGTQVIVPKHAETDTKYLYYLIARATEIIGSEGYKRHFNILKEFNTEYIESSQKQQKIAAILSSVDEVIGRTHAQIDKLKDLKIGMMQELLTKGIGHTEFKDSPVGRIPVVWQVAQLSDVMKTMANGVVGSASAHYRESGIPYLMSKNVRNNRLDLRGLTYISKEFHEKSSRSQLLEGDLLTVQSGHIGISAVVPKEFDGSNCHALIISKPLSAKINTHFAAYYLNSLGGRERLSKLFVGSTVPHINTSDLKTFLIPVPPIYEQEKISRTLHALDEKIDLIAKRLSENQSIKKALMHDLLTGKVRVNVEEKEPAVA